MAKDAKIIQRGMNVQGNDLAVPPGSMTDSKNMVFDRDGVAATRPGSVLQSYGLPTHAFEALPTVAVPNSYGYGSNQNYYDLFAGDFAFHMQGLPFVLDEVAFGTPYTPAWQCVPLNAPHMLRLHGDATRSTASNGTTCTGIGRCIAQSYGPSDGNMRLQWQTFTSAARFVGTVGNDAIDAVDSGGVQNFKFGTPFDVVTNNTTIYYSDGTAIRSGTLGVIPTTTLGSLTVSGTTDATGTAARFTNATWMAMDENSNVYVVDNASAIRKVTPGLVVTTLAGSVTVSGSLDGTGTAARFTNISGLAYISPTLYVLEGASAHRIRTVNVSTGAVAIFAGSITATSGFVDGVGTAARFNTPVGMEAVGSYLYVGDTVNNAIRRVTTAASVTTYAASSGLPSGNIGILPSSIGVNAPPLGLSTPNLQMPSITVRGMITYQSGGTQGTYPDGTYLCIECIAPNSSLDHGLVRVDGSNPIDKDASIYVWHVARSPNVYSTTTTGSNKMDIWGIDAYNMQDSRMADVTGGSIVTTSERPRIIDAFTRVSRNDPMPRFRPLGIDWPEAPSVTSATGTAFSANTAVAYQYLTGLKLPNGRIALGPPSERIVASSISSWAGSITAYPSPWLPYDGLPFVQLYRTKQASITSDPGNQMFLCNEQPITYGQGVVITDTCPDELLGAELYTNATEFGAASASLPPPAFANDVAGFSDSVVFSNYIPSAFCRIKVLGVSSLVSGTSTMTLTCRSPGGFDECKNLTINFNSAATDPKIKRAQIGTGGSAATNAVQTARNIVRVINRCADAYLFRAMYDENDPGSFVVYSVFPGFGRQRIAFDSLNQSTVSFTTNAATSLLAISQIPATRQQNGIVWSDAADPDSFPATSQGRLSSSDEAILRLLPIAETLLAVKERSVWRADNTFAWQIYDLALACVAPNSFARLNNQWIGLFIQGFRSLSGFSQVPIGRPLDRRAIAQYTADALVSGNYQSQTFAYATAIDTRGVYLCHFNNQLFSYSAYGDGAWGMWNTVYGTPKFLGKHRETFLLGFDAPWGTLEYASRTATPNLTTNGYQWSYFDGYVNLVVTSQPTSTTLVGTITSVFGTATPTGITPSLVGAVINDINGATIVSGSGTGGDPWILDLAVSLPPGSYTTFIPIEVTAQYAPVFAQTGAQFGDVVVTLERVSAGSLTCTWYGRNDYVSLDQSNNFVLPYGQYNSTIGTVRTNAMPSLTSTLTPRYLYNDVQRFATPSNKATDQQVTLALAQNRAFAPIAIKSVNLDYVAGDGTKVKR